MKRLENLLFGTTLNQRPADVGLLILRLFAGLSLALGHGLGKMPPSSGFVDGVGGMGFPLPSLFAWSAGFAELLGGIFLAVGLLTRPSALLIAITMGVAAFIRHAPDPFSSKEKALLFGCVAILYLIAGAGRYSVDALVSGKRR